jgi:ribosomal protein L7Ae-like RNA K-turn-binding protein
LTNKIYSFLGLAAKAGAVISGEDSCERAIRSKKVKLVVVADDAEDNTKKKFNNICRHQKIDIVFYGVKNLLGKYIGKDVRSVLTITDKGFAVHIKELIQNPKVNDGGEEIGKS